MTRKLAFVRPWGRPSWDTCRLKPEPHICKVLLIALGILGVEVGGSHSLWWHIFMYNSSILLIVRNPLEFVIIKVMTRGSSQYLLIPWNMIQKHSGIHTVRISFESKIPCRTRPLTELCMQMGSLLVLLRSRYLTMERSLCPIIGINSTVCSVVRITYSILVTVLAYQYIFPSRMVFIVSSSGNVDKQSTCHVNPPGVDKVIRV